MTGEVSTVRARFALRFRCANCRHVMCRELVSPALADAPSDVDELLGSNLLNGQFYPCDECDNPVSVLIGVKPLQPDEKIEVNSAEGETAGRRRTPPAVRSAFARAAMLSPARRRSLG